MAAKICTSVALELTTYVWFVKGYRKLQLNDTDIPRPETVLVTL